MRRSGLVASEKIGCSIDARSCFGATPAKSQTKKSSIRGVSAPALLILASAIPLTGTCGFLAPEGRQARSLRGKIRCFSDAQLIHNPRPCTAPHRGIGVARTADRNHLIGASESPLSHETAENG